MQKYIFFKQLFIAICIILLNSNCSGGITDVVFPNDVGLYNQIFSKSYLIITGIPAFNDTVSTTPNFTWRVTGEKLVYLGIFLDNIIVKNNSILNINDNVWAWHSGLGKGREGNVLFSDGIDVVNGELQEGKKPTPLISGKTYVWAVWAWDNDGIKIRYSSQELAFIVR